MLFQTGVALMTNARRQMYLPIMLICSVIGACSNAATPVVKASAPVHADSNSRSDVAVMRTKSSVVYEDSTPAANATIAITDLKSGSLISVVKTDDEGTFLAPEAGDYAFAVVTERGAKWIEKLSVANSSVSIVVSTECEPVRGRIVTAGGDGAQINFGRLSFNVGDTFVTFARRDGSFGLCLPAGQYFVQLTGRMLSTGVGIGVPSSVDIQLEGHLTETVKSPPSVGGTITYDIDGIVTDIENSKARLIGLGEATHGGSEFVTMRAKLTLELAKKAQLRLILLENDAIAVMAIDDYVNGKNVDLLKAVAALGFWVTDTYEFLRYLEEVRSYNMAQRSAGRRIRIWGIDVQNTELPVKLLLSQAAMLKLTKEDKELLQVIAPARGKNVKELSVPRRKRLDAMLLRLSAPRGRSDRDTALAVAARSLAIQVGYMDGDTQGLYAERRDAGMAQIASFVIDRLHAQRACLWAHNGHVARTMEGGLSMGQRLAGMMPDRYYAVGFYLFQGSSRAWDAAGEVGVISHAIEPAPPYTVEGAVMAASGWPNEAWVPFARLPESVREWLRIPRYVRELGAVYGGKERVMVLRSLRSEFDAVVVIRTVHDSSPTPTGVREVRK